MGSDMPMVMGPDEADPAADPAADPEEAAELQAATVMTASAALAARTGSLSGRGRLCLFMGTAFLLGEAWIRFAVEPGDGDGGGVVGVCDELAARVVGDGSGQQLRGILHHHAQPRDE